MPLRALDLSWALTASLPPLDFVLPGLLPGTFGLIVAPGATGKSQLALDIAVSTAVRRPVAGGLFPASAPGKTVLLAAEDSDRILAERIRGLLDLGERGDARIYDSLVLLPMAGESCTLVADGRVTTLFDELVAIANGARLVIIDPLRRVHDGDENCSDDMTRLVVAMERLGKATGAAVIGLHHANRASVADTASQHAARGSTALVDGARWQLNLSRMDEKTATHHLISEGDRPRYAAADFPKTNYLAPRPRVWLRRGPSGRLSLIQWPPVVPKGVVVRGARLLPT